MVDPLPAVVFAVFLIAGFVKGVLGLGLPTVSMGLLSVIMPPGPAAAMMAVPALATNFWQMVAGPGLPTLVKRLGAMLGAACIGTWLGAGLMTGPNARYGAAALGLVLIVYAVFSLGSLRIDISRDKEFWLGPIVGLLAGLILAATGVFVPAIIYLQGIGLEKEDLVQALGLSFTVSTLALSFNLIAAGILNISLAGSAVVALVRSLECGSDRMCGSVSIRRASAAGSSSACCCSASIFAPDRS